MNPIPSSEVPLPAGVRHPPVLLWAAGIAAVAVSIILLLGSVVHHQPFAFDSRILLSLRVPGATDVPIGPHWLLRAMTDVTALGGGTLIAIFVTLTIGLLLAQRLWLTAALIFAAVVTGSYAVSVLKHFVGRVRPDVVPHLVHVHGLSFPSGHSTSSAIVYLTLAALVSQVTSGRVARTYVVACAILLVGAIGFSRLYLGVHWPSDVLAGWSFGTLWALAWWLVGARVRRALA